MNKNKLFLGILVFGSMWGFSEVIIGSALSDLGMPSGALMTGFFALTFLVMSRMYYKQPGMQIGMGLVAGSLRLFNPFVGCHLCSALAIMAEGLIFEMIWIKIHDDITKDLNNLTIQASMGVVTAYLVFVSGYIVTQILTPIVQGTGFYLENLVMFMPNILAAGLIPALIGSVMLPIILLAKKLDISKIEDRYYYPTTISITLFCWIFVILSSFLLTS